jgi:hypothetical protein
VRIKIERKFYRQLEEKAERLGDNAGHYEKVIIVLLLDNALIEKPVLVSVTVDLSF